MDSPFQAPQPVSHLTDASLSRPDWLGSPGRDPSLVWLDKNENMDPDLLEVTLRIVREAAPHAICTYPELKGLYEKLGVYTGVDPKLILLTQASDGAIR